MATTSKAGDKPVKPAAKSAAKPKAVKATTTESAARKPVAKKSAAPKKATVKKPVSAASKSAATTKSNLAPEQRRFYVEVAAYYIAERRGFQGGSQLEDWANAEAEIDRLLREGILKP